LKTGEKGKALDRSPTYQGGSKPSGRNPLWKKFREEREEKKKSVLGAVKGGSWRGGKGTEKTGPITLT